MLSDRGIVVITIYVDNLIVGGDNEEEIEHVKSLLKQKFDMMGELRYFFGIEVIRVPEGIWLTMIVCIGYVVQVWYGWL